jgi:peptide/nickel transport system permease protein
VLSRTLHGARASLGLALVATAGTLLVGALLGSWAGMTGGLVERLVLKAGDVLMVLPVLYVVVALRAALPLVLPLPWVVGVLATIFVLLGWPRIARGVWAIVRAEARQEHVLAATALATRWRVMTRHLLPPATATSPCRRRCSCRCSCWPRRRCRTWGSGFPTACRAGARH